MNRKTLMGRGSRRTAFTIIEVIVIVVILGVIAAVIAPRLLGRIGQSKQAVAASNAASLFSQVQLYEADCGPPEPGSTLMILLERPGNVEEGKWHGPYISNPEQLKDPWGHDYVLVIPGQFNTDYDVVSYGADGQPGGEGDNTDIISGKKVK